MELVDCPHCSGKMSVYANSCPSCGFLVSVELVKKMFLKTTAKKQSFLVHFVFTLIALMLLISIAKIIDQPHDAVKHTIEMQSRLGKNDAHQQLENLVKRALSNPASYKVIDAGYWDQGDMIIVRMVFQAQNQYNESFQQLVFAKAKVNGDLLSVISPCPIDVRSVGGCEKLEFYSQSIIARILNWFLLSL